MFITFPHVMASTGSSETGPVTINSENILHFRPSDRSQGACILVMEGCTLFVQESFEYLTEVLKAVDADDVYSGVQGVYGNAEDGVSPEEQVKRDIETLDAAMAHTTKLTPPLVRDYNPNGLPTSDEDGSPKLCRYWVCFTSSARDEEGNWALPNLRNNIPMATQLWLTAESDYYFRGVALVDTKLPADEIEEAFYRVGVEHVEAELKPDDFMPGDRFPGARTQSENWENEDLLHKSVELLAERESNPDLDPSEQEDKIEGGVAMHIEAIPEEPEDDR